MYKVVNIILIVLIILTQIRLWSDEGGIPQISELEGMIEEQKIKNDKLNERNTLLYAQIKDLSSGMSEIEERARKNLGMIREGETFFIVVEGKEKKD